jgi:clan AA aspartic protease
MTPSARIEAIGSRQTSTLTAILDTGFDGDLCLPTRLAVQRGLELIGEQQIELADGTQRVQLVFAGSVRFFGETREVDIILTDSEDALIGTNLLNHYPLAIEFPGAQVKVRPRRKTGEKRKGT